MKTIHLQRWLATGAVAAILCGLAAQPLHAGPGGRRGGRPPGTVSHPLNLTDAQKKALEDAHTAIAEQSKTLRTQLSDAREALHDAVLAEKPVDDTIRAAAKKIGEIEGELAVIRAKELAKIRSLFSVEQWDALTKSHILHHLYLRPHDTDDDTAAAG